MIRDTASRQHYLAWSSCTSDRSRRVAFLDWVKQVRLDPVNDAAGPKRGFSPTNMTQSLVEPLERIHNLKGVATDRVEMFYQHVQLAHPGYDLV